MQFLQPDWPAPAHIKAYTTLRSSWGGRKSQQEWGELVSLLHLPAEPIWLNQTHSTIVIEASLQNKDKTADASYATQPNQVCVIDTADCLPILICNQQGTTVAAIHAGWRGLANGIIETTVQTLACAPTDLLVWLGPAIGPQKFEVGRDVYDAFTAHDPEAQLAFTPYNEEKWLANLYELARMRFKRQQVAATQIYGGQFCTYTQADWFFSYRRDHGKTGRMASVIWIGAENPSPAATQRPLPQGER
ncbi:MAG TPA: peptidoglycan editing factor PgeF [Gammaproteobacteria bacterium]|jgi:hypothetical protein|nr:peptidoglycan editing factor PgeF [Gammaproteobacteria bacterium]